MPSQGAIVFGGYAVTRSLFIASALSLFFLTAYVNGTLGRAAKDADVSTFLGSLLVIGSDIFALVYQFKDIYFPTAAVGLDFIGGLLTAVGIYFIRYHRVWDTTHWYDLQGVMIALSILVGVERGISLVMHAFWYRFPQKDRYSTRL